MTRSVAGSNAIEPALLARFRAALAPLLTPGAPLGLAVSGGADSLALLLLANAALPGGIAVATVDHGLRPAAAQECALVIEICAARAIPCDMLRVQLAPGNLQHAAREARYAALAGWAQRRGLGTIATAHHADDQAETLLMRLGRGSGVAGLAGVRAEGAVAGVRVIRPLLGFRRAELGAIVAAAGIVAVQDPSNADPQYDRVRLRQHLAECDWIDPAALARSAGLLAEAEQALAAYEEALWPLHVRALAEGYALRPPDAALMRMRLVRRIIGLMGGQPRGSEAARLVQRLERGEGGNLGGVLARAEAGEWLFAPEPERRS